MGVVGSGVRTPILALDLSEYYRPTTDVLIQETQRRQYEGHNTPLGYYTDRGPSGHSQYSGHGVYCGLSTAYEVSLMFTTTNI